MKEYYHITQMDLGNQSKVPLQKLGDSGEVFYQIALEMLQAIQEKNQKRKSTVFICPVGPVGQYPIFVRLVNEKQVSLKNCWFINMDEYLTEQDEWIDSNNPLSFRGFMNRVVYSQIQPHLLMEESQRIFPDPKDPQKVQQIIQQLGGVDIAFGGIGINGHLAFNEPQPEISVDEFSKLNTRVLDISPETKTTNAIGDLNGAIEAMPTRCITIGMAQILAAKKIRLGVFRDWHRAVVRRTAYGEISANFPATLLQKHPDVKIYLNENAAKQPF